MVQIQFLVQSLAQAAAAVAKLVVLLAVVAAVAVPIMISVYPHQVQAVQAAQEQVVKDQQAAVVMVPVTEPLAVVAVAQQALVRLETLTQVAMAALAQVHP